MRITRARVSRTERGASGKASGESTGGFTRSSDVVGPDEWGQSWGKGGRSEDRYQAECPWDCCKDSGYYSGSDGNHFERGFPESDAI